MTHTRFALATVLVLSISGCEKPKAEELKSEETKDEAPATNIKVDLPPSPNFDEGKAPEQWEDGSFSIYGLRGKLDENVKAGEGGKEVQVKGWVQEIYVAPPCPSGAKCPPSQLPHLWVTDTQRELGKKRALLVVGYEFAIPEFQAKLWKGVPGIVMEKDRRYRLRGRFKRFSDTGFAHDAGLFELVATQQLDDKGKPQWVYPRGAWWHPAVEGKLK